MSIRSQLIAANVTASSTVLSYRDRDTGEAIRSIDVSEYVTGKMTETTGDLLKAVACTPPIDVSSPNEDIESLSRSETFKAREVAAGLAADRGIDVDIPQDETGIHKLKLELLAAKNPKKPAAKKTAKKPAAKKATTDTVKV